LAGETGRAWLGSLPQQIGELERCWAITVGEPARRGSESLVAEARTSGGLEVILKIVIPGIDPTRQELRILRTANGADYAKLILSDEANNAMLLEKLWLQLHDFRFSETRRIEIICATLRAIWGMSYQKAIFCSLVAIFAVCCLSLVASSIGRSGSGQWFSACQMVCCFCRGGSVTRRRWNLRWRTPGQPAVILCVHRAERRRRQSFA
jgi:hypothetical protein